MTKLLAVALDAPIAGLLEMPGHCCQSCGMLLDGPGQRGHEADGSEPGKYCRWCYDKGPYTYETTMEDMIEGCAPRMAESTGWSVDECVSLMGRRPPRSKGGKTSIKTSR